MNGLSIAWSMGWVVLLFTEHLVWIYHGLLVLQLNSLLYSHWGHWWRRLQPTSSIITDAKSVDSNLDDFAGQTCIFGLGFLHKHSSLHSLNYTSLVSNWSGSWFDINFVVLTLTCIAEQYCIASISQAVRPMILGSRNHRIFIYPLRKLNTPRMAVWKKVIWL